MKFQIDSSKSLSKLCHGRGRASQLCLTRCNLLDCGRLLPAPLSVGFFRQEYWSGLPFPAPRNLLNPETEPVSPVSPALAGGFFTTGKPNCIASC